MSDNTVIQVPTTPGDVISTEDMGAYKIQRSKIVTGSHGTDGGDVTSSNPFPVNIENFPGTQTINGAVTASTNADGPVAPGTVANKSLLIGAVYNSSNPTPSNGQQLALQSDSSGNLKVNVVTGGGGGGGSVSDPSETVGNIIFPDTNSVSNPGAPGQNIISGTPTTNSTVVSTFSGVTSARIVLTTANFSGTVQFEKSVDGEVTWIPISVSILGVSNLINSVVFTGTESTQEFTTNVGSCTGFRIRCTAYSNGTLTVKIQPGYGVVEVAIPGNVHINSVRSTQVLHRTAISKTDVIVSPVNTAPTVSDVATLGSLSFNTTYYTAYLVSNTQGNTTCSGIATQLTANDSNNTHAVRLTIPQALLPSGSPVPNSYTYDIFLSTNTQPNWVGRITESQRAAGSTTITAVGVIGTGGPNPAGTVDIRVVGTGQQTNSINFTQNTAYVTTGLTPFNCSGYSLVHVQIQYSASDMRTVPSLTIVPALLNDLNSNQYHLGGFQNVPLNNQSGAGWFQEFTLSVDGSDGLIILVDTLNGFNATATIWLQPA